MAEVKEEKKKESGSPNRTNAILAWVFAPITSFIFMNDEDEFTKKCAKHSMYFGVASIVIYIVLAIIATVSFGILSCIVIVWSLADLAVRVLGAVKANEGKLFEVPVISGMVKE